MCCFRLSSPGTLALSFGAVLSVSVASAGAAWAQTTVTGGPAAASGALAGDQAAAVSQIASGENAIVAHPSAAVLGTLAGSHRQEAANPALQGAGQPTLVADAMSKVRALAGAGAEAEGEAASVSASERPLVVFVSWSMGKRELLEVLDAIAADGHGRAVVRGVLDQESVGKGIKRLADLVRALKSPAELDIDPPAFQKAAVRDVPAIWDPLSGLLWRGSVNLQSFRRALAAGHETGIVTMGPSLPVIEPDLAQVFRAKAAAADFSGERDQAIARYWDRAAMVGLPAAESGSSRVVDPTTWLAADLHDASGHIVATAGTPLRASGAHQLHHRLVIFDATDDRQVLWAGEIARQPGLPVILMVSDVDRASGWAGWGKLVKRLGMAVYVLPGQLAARLQLRAVPTLVAPSGDGEFLETEIGEDQLPNADISASR